MLNQLCCAAAGQHAAPTQSSFGNPTDPAGQNLSL